jgi:Phosphotransferase enzyme family
VTERVPPTGPRLLEDEGFVRQRVWPLVARNGRSSPHRVRLGVITHRSSSGRRHAVAEYVFDDSIRVVAKLYADTEECRAAHEILRVLRHQGFGAHSPYRVPEPIAYLPDHAVLLMSRAQGEPLGEMGKVTRGKVVEGLEHAARWLSTLHIAPLQLGPTEDRLRDAFRLTRRLTRAARCQPDLDEFFRSAGEELAGRSASVTEPTRLVQTHGRYELRRVFLAPDQVTVTGLDRAAVADPMRDLGEFVHRLRWDGTKAGLPESAVEDSTRVFLDEYARTCATDCSSLSYQWSYSILWTLTGLACSRRATDGDGRPLDRLRDEFLRVPQLASAWIGLSDA